MQHMQKRIYDREQNWQLSRRVWLHHTPHLSLCQPLPAIETYTVQYTVTSCDKLCTRSIEKVLYMHLEKGMYTYKELFLWVGVPLQYRINNIVSLDKDYWTCHVCMWGTWDQCTCHSLPLPPMSHSIRMGLCHLLTLLRTHSITLAQHTTFSTYHILPSVYTCITVTRITLYPTSSCLVECSSLPSKWKHSECIRHILEVCTNIRYKSI